MLTVIAVLSLLTFGGTWKRIEEQAKFGASATAPDSITQRKQRALLMERLLESREWMLRTNYPVPEKERRDNEKHTPLTTMLMMEAPIAEEMTKEYENNYKAAYRRCQDKPGGESLTKYLRSITLLFPSLILSKNDAYLGPILGGRPYRRFEVYARAFASCGNHVSIAYRISYARMLESLAGKSHESDDRFKLLFSDRPNDIIGRTVRLEPLEEKRHLNAFWEITSGHAYKEHKAYNPDEVWGFLDCGPFEKPQQCLESEVFQLEKNQAAFAIVECITDRLLGIIHLTKDDPKNLNIQMELPILKPSSDVTPEQLEACFLLLDRLFAYGYRRVQICVDTQDVRGKRLPMRLGFTQEGEIPKHMIVKEANRDSFIFGMLNSDWDKGARALLFKKLHGAAAQKADAIIVAKEEAAIEENMQ